ncbi:MAG: hypothetical protein WCP18_02850 [bacterium]
MTLLIILFFLGILAQAIFLLFGKIEKSDWKIFGLCLLISLSGFWPSKHDYPYNIYSHLFVVAIFFSIALAVTFKKKILQTINKEILLLWNLIFIYAFFQNDKLSQNNYLILAIIILSLPTIINAFTNFDKKYLWRAYLYIWFLILIISLSILNFDYIGLYAFNTDTFFTPPIVSPEKMFFTGMAFLYLTINIWYLFELIPLPGKHQSIKNRLNELKKDIAILASDYKSEIINKRIIITIFILTSVLLFINYLFRFIADSLLIPFIISCIPLIDKLMENYRPPKTSNIPTPPIINTNA